MTTAIPSDTREFLGIGEEADRAGFGEREPSFGRIEEAAAQPSLPDGLKRVDLDAYDERTRNERAALFRAAGEELFRTDVSKLDDAGAWGLYHAVTESMFGLSDEDGTVAFGKRASKDPRANIDMLRRFVKGEYSLIEDPEYTKWREMDDEAKFRYAMENESDGNKLRSYMKGERGAGFWENIRGGLGVSMVGLPAGAAAFQPDAIRGQNEKIALESARRSNYENLTDEEKAQYRADVVADYDEKLSRRQTLATFLQFSQGLSDRASYLLAKSFNDGTLDPQVMTTIRDKEEQDRVLSAFSMMRGDQKSGTLLFVPTDFTDGTSLNRLQMGLYGFQQSVLGLATDSWDMVKNAALWTYAKTALSESERKEFFDWWNSQTRAEQAMKQELPEADSFLGEAFQGVAENIHWFIPYSMIGKGGKMVTAARGLKEGDVTLKGWKKMLQPLKDLQVTIKPMRLGGDLKEQKATLEAGKATMEAGAAATKAAYTLDINGVKKLGDYGNALVARQLATVDTFTQQLRDIDKSLKAAKWWKDAAGTGMWAFGEASAFSAFASEYIASADAAGVSREESVTTAALVGLINAKVERLYVPGLESSLTPAQLKSMMWSSALQAIRSDGAAGFRRWLFSRIPKDAAQIVKVSMAETLEEGLQQMAVEHGKAFDRLCGELRESGQATLADEARAFWSSFAETLPQDYATFVDTAADTLPSSVGFGLTSVANMKARQHLHNVIARHANRRAGATATDTMFNLAQKGGNPSEAFDYDEGIVDYLQRTIDVRNAVEKHWQDEGGEGQENPHRFEEAVAAARRAFRDPQTGDVVREVADAAGVDVKTAEVLAQYLQTEAEAAAFSPTVRAWTSLNMSLADIDEETIKTVLPGYVEGSFASDPEAGVYSGKVKLADGTERTIAYKVGDISEELMAQVETKADPKSAFGKSFDARHAEIGDGVTWASLSDQQRYMEAVRSQASVNGFSSGTSGVFEMTDAKGEKVRVNANDVIYLASGRIADIGYGPAATQGTARHETFHSLWRFARASMEDADVQALAKALGIDVTKDGWEIDLDEKMAHEMERYASGHYVSSAVSSRFDKMISGWAGKVIDFFGQFGPKDEVTDPKTGKPFQLKNLYDRILRGELGSGALGVELAKLPSQPATPTSSATTSTMPVEVTDAEREEAEAEARKEAARAEVDEAGKGDGKLVHPQNAQTQAQNATVDENGVAATKSVHPSVPVATAENPAAFNTPNQRYYKIRLPNSDAMIVGRLEVRDADTGVLTSWDEGYHDRNLQNRVVGDAEASEEDKKDSEAKLVEISAHPDPLLMAAPVATANDGVPWALPNGDMFIGNHRVQALRIGYQKGTAADYERYVREDAAKRGIEIGSDVKRPLLVFVLERIESPDGKMGIYDVVKLANKGNNREFGKTGTAKNDAKILIDNNLLPRMKFRIDGRIDETKSGDAIGKFRSETGAQEFLNDDGTLTESGEQRIIDAALFALLGGTGKGSVLRKIESNSKRLDMQGQLRALMKMTPELMALGRAKPAYDLRAPLAEALQLFTEWRDKDETARVEKGKTRHDWRETKNGSRVRGISWEQFMSQGDMFRKPSEEARILGDLFARAEAERSFDREDVESAAGKKRVIDLISDYLTDYIRNARAVNTETGDMFGGTPATRADVLAAQRAAGENGPRFSISGIYTGSAADYDKPSLHAVGTGEGSQVYGWGLYGSAKRGVAELYARNAAWKRRDPDTGEPIATENIYEQTWFTNRAEGDESHLLKWYEEVSDENWDRIIQQADKEGLPERFEANKRWLNFKEDFQHYITDLGNSGESVYQMLSKFLGSPQAASEFLYRAGIDGIKYPVDSYGKTVKDGDVAGWNYVSFSDENIRVDHKWTDGQMRYSISVTPEIRRETTVDAAEATLEKTKTALAALAGKNLHNDETGIDAQINSVQARKIVSNKAVERSIANGFTAQEHNAAAAIIETLWKHATLGKSETDRDADPNIASVKRFVAPVFFSEDARSKAAYAYITAKESTEHGHRVYSIEIEKLEALGGRLGRSQALLPSASGVPEGTADNISYPADESKGGRHSVADNTGSFSPENPDIRFSIAAKLDDETRENQPNFYEWLNHGDNYELVTDEGLREHMPEEWWDRQDNSHVGPNALREIANPEMRYSIAGQRGAASLGIGKMEDAEAMEKTGADREDIWRKTGWWRGKDGKWRIELPDMITKPAKEIEKKWVKLGPGQDEGHALFLRDLIDAEEIFKAYPDLGEIKVHALKKDNGNKGAEYDEESDSITLYGIDSSTRLMMRRDILAHEVQHAIQSREAFAKGGSPGEFSRVNVFALEQERISALHAKDFARAKEIQELIDIHNHNHDDGWVIVGGKKYENELVAYESLVGEVESRNVEKRLGMTAEERAATPPWETEDTPTDRQIVRFSIAALPSGEKFVLLDRPNKIDWNDRDKVREYLTTLVGTGAVSLADEKRIEIGNELPDEYTRSSYAEKAFRNMRLRKVRGKTAQHLDELIAVSGERTAEPSKHKKREGGVYYRRGVNFGVFGHEVKRGYSAELVTYEESGQEYLYDLVNIKDNPSLVPDSATGGNGGFEILSTYNGEGNVPEGTEGNIPDRADEIKSQQIVRFSIASPSELADVMRRRAANDGATLSVNPNLSGDIEAALTKRTEDAPDANQMKRHEEIVFSENLPFFDFLGLPNLRVVTDVVKIRKFKIKHHLTEEQIADLPNRYNAPVAVMKDGTDGYALLTDMIAEAGSRNQKPVMVYLRLKTTKSGEKLFIATAFAHDAEREKKFYEPLIRSGLLFVNENKVSGLALEEETESILRTQASGDFVKTAEDFSKWSTARSISQTGSSAQQPRFSFGAPRQKSAYPALLKAMSDEELLSAAVAARIALGKSDKVSDRSVKVKTVQNLVRRLHPEWDSTKIGVESQRIISGAQKLAKRMREDIDRGVSDSLILEHLPETMRAQFGSEMRQEARKGARLGAFGVRANAEIEERQARIVESAVRVQTGIDAKNIENAYGINLSETIMHLAENPLTEQPPQTAGGAAETGEEGAASAENAEGEEEQPAAEIDAKVKAVVADIIGAAKAGSDADERNRQERRSAAGRDAERKAEMAAEDSEGSAPGDLSSGEGDALAAAVKKEGLNLENPRHLARFVAELARRQYVKEHGLALDADVWRDLVAVQFLRKTAESVYEKLCRDLTYSRGRETAMQHIAKFDAAPTVAGLLSEMEFVGALINARRIRDKQKQLCEKLDLFLRQKFGAQGRFKPDKEEGKRSVSAEAELRARYMRHAMWLTPDAAAEEARQLQETLDALSVDFKDAGRDRDQSREFVETIRKLNVLREFGALRYKPVGAIEAAAQWWEDFARGESDDIVREMLDRDIRTKKAAHLLAVAFADPTRTTIREGGKADALNRFITGHMGFISLLQDCMRHASDADAAAVKDILGYISREIQKSGDRTEAEKRRHNMSFTSAVESIYGKSFSAVMKDMAATDERFTKYMGVVGGKRVTPTRGRAMQLLVSLLQEGRKVEIEDEENPGKTKFIWEGGYHDNIVKHKREKQADEIMRLLTPSDMNMIKWLGQWYENNRSDLSDVCNSLFGIGVYAELPNYFPVKMMLEKQGLEKGEGVSWTIFPKALTPRVKNERDFDTSADIFSMWASRMEEAAQWKHHAQLGLEMRGIFGRAELREAVRANHGASVDDLMQGFITDILAGHGAYDRSTAGVEYFSDQIRGWTALCALGGNIGVMAKQTTSIPAFGFEIGLVNTAKYMVNAFTPEGMSAMLRIWDSEQRQTRWNVGSSEVIRNALNQNGAGVLKRMFQASMITTKVGDVVPALVVGQGIYRDCLARGMSDEDAMAETWSIIERTQQSGRMENQTSIQRRNKLGRIMFQFLSTQQQYLQYETRAIRDVIARPDSVKRWGTLGRAILLNHFILSSAYFWMGELYKACLGQEPPEDELKDWMITCLLGPYGSLMVAGFCCKATLERAIKGYSIRGGSSMLPMEQWIKTQINDGARLMEAIFDSEGDTLDNMLDAAGRWMGDVNSTVRDLRKLYRFRIKGEPQGGK